MVCIPVSVSPEQPQVLWLDGALIAAWSCKGCYHLLGIIQFGGS